MNEIFAFPLLGWEISNSEEEEGYVGSSKSLDDAWTLEPPYIPKKSTVVFGSRGTRLSFFWRVDPMPTKA